MSECISIIGGGSWGTALADLIAGNGYEVTVFAKEKEVVGGINKDNENGLFLAGHKLHSSIKAEALEKIKESKVPRAVWAVPTQFSRDVAAMALHALEHSSVMIATKGIEISTGELIYDILSEELNSNLTILSGPSFAKEVAAKKPTAVSIASNDEKERSYWQEIVSNTFFRAYTSEDVIGVEVGGAIKNVIAIATGISDGLGFGLNARAGLITRGLAEITRLGLSLGAKHETFMGLSGMGDLVLTATGDLSRNRNVGLKIAEGLSLKEITENMKMVAEGVFTAKAAHFLAEKVKVEMPITNEVYKILYEDKKPYQSVMDLMSRDLKSESVK
ncbi:Glycerol-3-phosphate dehydrogenase (NAD(P)+) [Flexistipes sinusarabici DSM 4947]|uniref:Glycerol-3-phosphate dehydrogenase [NAD(P)+] n=1 Tax=Flexistipes sinusarabici (strain ATCC 49648 / DSM 4947 / MAS 10) TaxID=717231 RepID=F8E7R1_FLESM|nr:NAD(P)H-dependent glycerol-3-phosphate dehydrogenase [Flexistipes sinusarabici]AEI13906.1 Glycerol-3-phosphate dehydrogenase (NAD(P)+) [Flexistipes sinusarabici DSM 4947]